MTLPLSPVRQCLEASLEVFHQLKGLELKRGSLNMTWTKMLETVLPSLRQLNLDGLLNESESAEVRHEKLVAEFEADPLIRTEFIEGVMGLRKTKDLIPLSDAVRVLGIQNSILYFLSAKVARQFPEIVPKAEDPRSRLVQGPSQVWKVSVAYRMQFGEDSQFRDTSFAAGFVFDWLVLVAARHPDAALRSAFRARSEVVLVQLTQLGQLALKLTPMVKSQKLQRFLPAVFLLLEIAELWMLLEFPAHLDVIKKFEKEKIPHNLQIWTEQTQYKISAPVVASALASQLKIFQDLAQGLRFISDPDVLLHSDQKDLFDLMALCGIAIELQRTGRKMIKPEWAALGSEVNWEAFGAIK